MNREDLLLWLNRYLTKRFIADPDSLPKDECEYEAEVIFNKVLPLIFEEIEKVDLFFIDDGYIYIHPTEWQTLKAKYLEGKQNEQN